MWLGPCPEKRNDHAGSESNDATVLRSHDVGRGLFNLPIPDRSGEAQTLSGVTRHNLRRRDRSLTCATVCEAILRIDGASQLFILLAGKYREAVLLHIRRITQHHLWIGICVRQNSWILNASQQRQRDDL